MRRFGIVVALVAGALGFQPVAWASNQAQAPDSTTVTMPPPSQIIRQAGYSLTDAEAAYLDADQQVGQQFATTLLQVMALAGPNGSQLDAASQGAVIAALQKIIALNPSTTPSAPPSLQHLQELAVQQRQATQRAAADWLAALQAGDPNWWQAGADDFATAAQGLQDWKAELQALYPPPQQQQP